eukprot:3935941-Pyramimonas_sp.AAC.1
MAPRSHQFACAGAAWPEMVEYAGGVYSRADYDSQARLVDHRAVAVPRAFQFNEVIAVDAFAFEF